jgi:PleD family two-component response regulator
MKPREPRRVLVAACSTCAPNLMGVFAHPALNGWEVLHAESLSQSRFHLQHSPCDVLAVSGDLVERDGAQALAWLAQRGERPIIYLAGNDAEALAGAYRAGIALCVPQRLALEAPQVLAAALEQALAKSKTQRQQRHLRSQLQIARRHVDRLVGLIWRTTPAEPNHQWFPQRFALERLHEELTRSKRHGVPLSVALGELEGPETNAQHVTDWLAASIGRVKRRSDVAGQYGLRGFILVMVHTGKEGGVACCRRLRDILETPAQTGSDRVRAYFGLTSTTDHQPNAPCLLRWAEQNLELARGGSAGPIVAL